MGLHPLILLGFFENIPNGVISTFARFERQWLKSGEYVAGFAQPTVADIAMFSDFSFAYTLLHLDHVLTPELYPALVPVSVSLLPTRLSCISTSVLSLISLSARLELPDAQGLEGHSAVSRLFWNSGTGELDA